MPPAKGGGMEIFMDNYKKEIGLRLKQARKNNGYTQEKIAELLGISQKHYSEVERGITGLSVKNLIDLSDILSVSLDYILKGTTSNNISPTEKMGIQLNELFFSSSDYTQMQMLKVLNIIKDIEKHTPTS